jgi:hypothetical protein
MTSAFEITDRYVDVLCEEFPLLATQLGDSPRITGRGWSLTWTIRTHGNVERRR